MSAAGSAPDTRGQMRKLYGVIACAVIVLSAAASTASAGLTFSASDDAGKYARDKGRSFVSLLTEIGFTQNRITVRWDASRPTTIVDKPFLEKYVPKATRQGIRIVFAIYPETATGITGTTDGQTAFVNFVAEVARKYPQVTKIVVGNEPNQPRFWQPQFNQDGSAAAGPAYEATLAQAYDALKAVNPAIDVIGVAVNSRGNDNPQADGNVSTSPVKFIRDMGVAYHTSARTAPIMDEIAVHPYPAESTDPISKGFRWPNAGFVNLDRFKQAVWDAFHGTAQPVFAEGPAATSVGGALTMRIDEIAWQTAIPAADMGAYHGTENVPVTDDATQAAIYADLVKQAECDPSLSALSFFGIVDESDLAAFQGGLIRADGTVRPSYDAVRQTIAQTGGKCVGTPVDWSHSTTVAERQADLRQPHPAACEADRLELRDDRHRGRHVPRRDLPREGPEGRQGHDDPARPGRKRPRHAHLDGRGEGLLRAARPVPAASARRRLVRLRDPAHGGRRPRPDELLPQQAVPRRLQKTLLSSGFPAVVAPPRAQV